MKRIFIIHGWDYNPEMNWYLHIKNELEKKGYVVFVPSMPNTSTPSLKEWTSHLKKVVGKLDEETYFIGHSIGCQTIMRYLENENFKGKINKVVFVAGWFKLENLEDEEVESIAKPWLDTPINYFNVKLKINNLTVFLSSNDPYNSIKENEKIFKDKLGAKVIVLKNKGHFTSDDGITTIKEVLDEF